MLKKLSRRRVCSERARHAKDVAGNYRVSAVIEQDNDGFYAYCPELKGCQSQGNTAEEPLANIREAIDLFLETLTAL